jgi:hypothetical protein
MLFRRLLYICAAAINCLFLACHPPRSDSKGPMKEEYVIVADFTPDHRSSEALDQSIKELESILSGIECGLDGSRSYRVIVASSKAEKARQLLKAARFKRGGTIVVF